MATDEQTGEAPDAGLDINQGAETLFGLLSTDQLDQPASDVDEDESLEPEHEDPDSEVEPEGGDDAEEYEDDDEFPEDEVEDEADDETADDDPPQTYKVQVDGEELEVTLDEALAGYQRQQAFTRKTQAVAEERKQAQQEAETLRERQLEYGQALQNAEAFVRAAAPEEATWTQEQWQDLRRKSPSKYADRMDAFQGYQQRLHAVQQEQQKLMHHMSEANEKERQARLQEEQEALVSRIPDWVDDETRAREQQELVEYATSTYDYTPEDVGAVVDHRVVDILRKAMLYDKMQAEAPKIRKKTRKKDDSANLKPGTSSGKKPSRASKSKKAARNRLRKSGSVHDAAATLHGILD